MWLLGAGASAESGIPTAWDMIWEFKQQLYVSQKRISPKAVADLSNPAVRNLLQSFVDSLERFPSVGSPEEYAALFEASYPNENDRRTYIAAKLSGAKPSYGHIALATLMKADRARIVWTTNFDPLVADACAKVYDGTGYLTTVALDAPDLARDLFNGARWPAEIKLHGDFRSRRLKNTGDELRQQDARLRDLLVDACHRSGLIVVGYSGRDDSIMDTLDSVLSQNSPFPGGLFWLHRGEDPPMRRVERFLATATERDVEGGLVAIDSFDETLRDLIRLLKGVDTSVLDSFTAERRIWSPAPFPTGRRGFPVVRLNALEVTTLPTVCRRVVCDIGGHAEILAATLVAGVELLATRSQLGVLAFGDDVDVRKAFAPFDIQEFDLHPIELRRLRYESSERGLLRQALSQALARNHGLMLTRRRTANLLAPADPSEVRWQLLRKLVGDLSGCVPNHPELVWREGVGTRLDWADDRLWLLFEPRTVMSGVTAENRSAATDFSRERVVRRYNKQLNELTSFWSELLGADGTELRALGIAAGVDAVFNLATDTAFSRRSQG
jgi:NAD-dependent SIR2 family protein deacetylase